MGAILKIQDIYLDPVTDAVYDLGSSTIRFKNSYVQGINSATTLSSSSDGTVIFTAVSSTTTDAISTRMKANTGTFTTCNVTSVKGTNSSGFLDLATSSLTIRNTVYAAMNAAILIGTATTSKSGDFWLQASNNTMYLFTRSTNVTYWVQMGTS